MSAGEIRYADTGDGHVAYASLGSGPANIVWVPAMVSNLEVVLDGPWSKFVDSFGALGRLVMFDRRGIGLSDPAPSDNRSVLDVWIDDFNAVADALSLESATLVSFDTGSFIAACVAATMPQRVGALVMVRPTARIPAADNYLEGADPAIREPAVGLIEHQWGTGVVIRHVQKSPTMCDDPYWSDWWAKLERAACGPGHAASTFDAFWDLDIRSLLATIHAPITILAHHLEAPARALTRWAPHATVVELEDADPYGYFFGDDFDRLVTVVSQSATGRPVDRRHRALAAVLFTDIVDSTGMASRAGDAAWRRTLESHDGIAHQLVTARRGRVVKATGDGLLALFETPGNAIVAAQDMHARLARLGIEIRAGIHVGEVEHRSDGDITGLAVNVAARVMATARPQETLVTRTVCDLVGGSGFAFEYRGAHDLRGIAQPWDLYTIGKPS